LSAFDQKINQHEQEQWAVSQLESPPPLADTEDLRRIIVRLATSTRDLQLATGELNVLEAAATPPALLDEAPLAILNAAIAKASSQHNRWQAESDFLARLMSPPIPVDLEGLAEVVYNFDKFAEEVRSWGSQAAAAEGELRKTGEELR